MVVLHGPKLIFVKTRKTAGSSIEAFLWNHRGPDDILSPIRPPVEPHRPQNHRGLFNPFSRARLSNDLTTRQVLGQFRSRQRFYNHMTARELRSLVGADTWADYTTFCVERDPWDKVMSAFAHMRQLRGGTLSLDAYIREEKFPVDHPYYVDESKDIMVDHVLRYERLDEELGELLAERGIRWEGSLPVRAKANHRSASDRRGSLSPAQRRIVERHFAWEIETFGYVF